MPQRSTVAALLHLERHVVFANPLSTNSRVTQIQILQKATYEDVCLATHWNIRMPNAKDSSLEQKSASYITGIERVERGCVLGNGMGILERFGTGMENTTCKKS